MPRCCLCPGLYGILILLSSVSGGEIPRLPLASRIVAFVAFIACDKMRQNAISHLSHAISHFVAFCRILSHAISHFVANLKKVRLSECLKTVWNFPGGTENKSDVFLHVIRKRIFCQHGFFLFSHTQKMRREAETAV